MFSENFIMLIVIYKSMSNKLEEKIDKLINVLGGLKNHELLWSQFL